MTQSAVKSFVFTVFVAVLFVACSNTKLTDTQVNENLRGKSVSGVLVIMVTDDNELRKPFEDGFVAQLQATGVDAVSSSDVIAIPGDQKLEKDEILKAVNEFQNDAVLISHLVDVEKYEASNSPTASFGGIYDYYDYAYLMSSKLFDIEPCTLGMVLQEYLIWYDWQIPSTDYTAYRCKLYRLLRAAGYYRGDVGDFATGAASPGDLTIADIVYIVQWMWSGGPDPEPFVDQGDVNCDGEVTAADVVYLVGYILRGSGIPPVDKDRFFDEPYRHLLSRTSLFADPQWQTLGSGCPLDR